MVMTLWTVGQDDGGCGFAKVQSEALDVEGAARLWREGFEGLEARNDKMTDDIATGDDGGVVESSQEQALGCDDGRDAGDAGVTDYQGWCLDAHHGGYAAGRVGRRLGRGGVDVGFCGAEDKQGPVDGNSCLALREGLSDALTDEGLKPGHALHHESFTL